MRKELFLNLEEWYEKSPALDEVDPYKALNIKKPNIFLCIELYIDGEYEYICLTDFINGDS